MLIHRPQGQFFLKFMIEFDFYLLKFSFVVSATTEPKVALALVHMHLLPLLFDGTNELNLARIRSYSKH